MSRNVSVKTDSAPKRDSRTMERLKEFWRRFKKNKAAVFGLVVLILLVLLCIFADQIADPALITKLSKDRKQGPSMAHLFGTDHMGRDLFARVIHAAPTSLTIGFTTAFFSLIIGASLGVACAYFGGRFDDVTMRIVDVLSSIPGNLLAMVVMCVLGDGMTNLIIAMVVGRFRGMVRMSRSAAIGVANNEYIEAAQAGGSPEFRTILRHIVPNIMGTLIVSGTMSVSASIISACGLSFIGLGVQPPTPEWGYMLNEARSYMEACPHLMLFPGLALVLTSLSINLVGDGLRDALDPKLKT